MGNVLTLPPAIVSSSVNGRPDASDTTAELNGPLPAPVVVPQGLVLRAIDNLLANAAKFTPDDSPIEVTVSTVDSHASLVVRDHGAGVAAADMARIFDRFYRADVARSLPGSGLGLAIVHDIAMSQRGSVSATNSEDGGAMFTLTLPLAPVSVASPPVGLA